MQLGMRWQERDETASLGSSEQLSWFSFSVKLHND